MRSSAPTSYPLATSIGTDAEYYTLPALTPGRHGVPISKPGFNSENQAGVVWAVHFARAQQEVRLDLVRQTGEKPVTELALAMLLHGVQ